jgi:hypothetical protein
MVTAGSLLGGLPPRALPEEVVETLCRRRGVRLRIDGEAQDRALAPGDYLLLPAHCRHRVTWTERDAPTIWLAIHFSPTG